ncbi:biopolymer transporter ExbD [uncultured Tateyamaria sp.]|uniref:ExbD/TolR family protein n=1 Tax=uncultured Tateyamaria sp. TaxID=455651 RepID=UPI00261230AA|nr:biopolymer transporter ExbD [uncultured Tateyamaria sp.]
MRARGPRSRREPTIALINIVFLMLVFFMVAGTLSPPLDKDLALVSTGDLEGRPPPDALVIHADGTLSYRGADQPDAATYVAELDTEVRAEVRIVPDRDLPAIQLVALGRDLRRAGAGTVIIVTERGLE